VSTQSPTAEQIRAFVIAAHSDFDKVKSMLTEHIELLNLFYSWSETDHETPIMAAAHMGQRPIAEYLIGHGAPVAIYTAAMLGQRTVVADELSKDPTLINARGAHGIPLLAHAALSGDVDLMKMLTSRGAQEGLSFALSNAVEFRHGDLVRWLLENTRPDLAWQNWQQKTALSVALAQGNQAMASLLREHGATE
jgi:uncharacterized protein